MTPLRQRFLDELARRNYSPRTVEAYLAGVLRFVRHYAPGDKEKIGSRRGGESGRLPLPRLRETHPGARP
jgi:hypothetical protein